MLRKLQVVQVNKNKIKQIMLHMFFIIFVLTIRILGNRILIELRLL
jgi:hypothetical protein